MEQSEFVKSFAGSEWEKKLRNNIFKMGMLPIILETGCTVNSEAFNDVVSVIMEEALTNTAKEFSPEELQLAADSLHESSLEDDNAIEALDVEKIGIEGVVAATRVSLKIAEYLEPAIVDQSVALMNTFIGLPEDYE